MRGRSGTRQMGLFRKLPTWAGQQNLHAIPLPVLAGIRFQQLDHALYGTKPNTRSAMCSRRS
jgi:hypothetical protein